MLQPVGRILNWHANNDKLTRGLKTKLTKIPDFTTSHRKFNRFVTIRLNIKWSDRLNPGDCVSVSISDDTANPNIFGYARVRSVKKTRIAHLTTSDLNKNIGAKTRRQVLSDMQSVYNNGSWLINPATIVSVIELES